VFVLVVLFFALLISYPWWVLSIGTVCYLACLPFGWFAYREHQRRDAIGAAQPAVATDVPASAPDRSITAAVCCTAMRYFARPYADR